MPADIDQLTAIDEPARRAFESAWHKDQRPAITDFLPADHNPLRLATLEELVHIDLEFSHKDGSNGAEETAPSLEDYLAQFPELQAAEIIERLCLHEFQLRHRCGDDPQPDEYLHRFPALAETLDEFRGAVQQIVAEDEQTASGDEMTVDLMPSVPRSDENGSNFSAVSISGVQSDFDTLNSFLDAKRGNANALDREKTLAQGGMGEVLACRDHALHRRVAVKVMKPEIAASEEYRLRFLEEAQVTGQLEHPNIVPIHDLGKDAEGNLYFSMKLVKGQSLGQILTEMQEHPERERPITELLEIFLKVADGLAFAHSKCVVHRDLKPDNIMVGDFGEVLIMDWGLAKLLDRKPANTTGGTGPTNGSATDTANVVDGQTIQSVRATTDVSHTVDGTIQGTPAYMPPEQALGEIDRIDHRSDIYSLGAILYQILTLQRPVTGTSATEVLLNVCDGNVVPPAERMPGRRIPKELSAVVMKAMQPAREDRYQSVKELARDIRLFLDGWAVSAKQDSLWESLVKLIRRNRAVSAAVAIAGTIILVLSTVSYLRITSERDRAVANEKTANENWKLAQENERQARENEQRALSSEQQARQSEQQAIDAKQKQWESALAASRQFALQSAELANTNRFEPARRRASDAAIVASEGPWQYFAQGAIAMAQTDFAKAAELYRTGLSTRDGDQPEIRAALADALARQGKLEEAQGLLADIDSIDDWRVLLSAGRTLYAAHKWEACQRPLARAIELMTGEKDRPADDLLEAERLLEAAPAQNACEGFYDEIRNLPLSRLHKALEAKFTEIHGRQIGVKIWEYPDKGIGIDVGSSRVRHLYPLRGLPIRHLKTEGGSLGSVWDLSPLIGMPLVDLTLAMCRELSDLRPLEDVSTLESLAVTRSVVVDLAPLHKLRLKRLHFTSAKVKDLTPLAGMPLEHLTFSAPVSDLSPLKGMKLKELNLGNMPANNLEFLRGMPLEVLTFGFQVKDLSPLTGMPLRELSFGYGVSDLSPLKGMPLEKLTFHGCPVTDLSPLSGAPLKQLDLERSTIHDLQPLTDAPLEYLSLRWTPVTDLTPLRDSPLTVVRLFGCWIKDYSPLATMKNLDEEECPWVPYLLGKTAESDFLAKRQVLYPGDPELASLHAVVYMAMKEYAEGNPQRAASLLERCVDRFGNSWRVGGMLIRLREELADDAQPPRN